MDQSDCDRDQIERIIVDYHRNTKINTDNVPHEASWEHVVWDYSEQLTIDRKSETIEHIQNIGSGCQVYRRYHVEEGVASFLDDIIVDELFSRTTGNPPDVIRDPQETKDYTITIEYLHGEPRVLKGSFDKNGLPSDFAEFAEDVFGFITFYGMGEILDPAVYRTPLRRTTDMIFCNVKFEDSGKIYCYLTDDETLEVGDCVVVPAGKDNHDAIAQIESIEYHSAQDAPYPMDKIKRILEKYKDMDDEDGPGYAPPDETDIISAESMPARDIYGREVSPSMCCPEYAISSCPLCNGCDKWTVGTNSCKKYLRGIPKDIRSNEYHECDEFELDESSLNAAEVKHNIERLR